MGRKPKVRVMYQHDATYLMNLADAVSRDTNQSVEWREKVQSLLHELSAMFLKVTAERINRMQG